MTCCVLKAFLLARLQRNEIRVQVLSTVIISGQRLFSLVPNQMTVQLDLDPLNKREGLVCTCSYSE